MLKGLEKPPAYVRALLWALVFGFAFFLPFFLRMNMARNDWNLAQALMETDFQNIWIGARKALSGDIAALFDHKAYQEELPFQKQFYVWSYPLHLLLFIFPMGWLPYPLALTAWSIIGLGAFLYVCKRELPPETLHYTLPLIAFAPASIINLQVGQNGFYTAALLIGGLYLLKNNRQGLSGISFGVLTVKPHLGVLIPFLMLFLKKWKAFGIACLASLALLAIATAIWGAQYWPAYLNNVLNTSVSGIANFDRQPFTFMQLSNYTSFRAANLSAGLALALHSIIAIPVVIVTFTKTWKNGLTDKNIFLVVLATMITLPYLFNYDFTAVSAMLVICLAKENPGRNEMLIPGLLFALPMLTYIFRMVNLPLTAIILTAGFIWAYKNLQEQKIYNAKDNVQ